MVDVLSKRCIKHSCTNGATLNGAGCNTATYCKQHTGNDIVNVLEQESSSSQGSISHVHRRQSIDFVGGCCSHESCTRPSSWGALTEGAASVCDHHKRDILCGPVINFRARCKLAGCGMLSSWGLGGKQPTHCADHGPLEYGFVCTIAERRARSVVASSALSDRALKSSAFHVKAECSF